MIDLRTDIPFGLSFPAASINGVVTYPTPAGSPPANAFILTNYGADPTGIDDSGLALQAAADAAAAVATAESPADVWIPAGTYKCIPQGAAIATMWEKVAGTWTKQSADKITTAQVVTGTGSDMHFVASDPTTQGADGDIAFQFRSGKVWRKASGAWAIDGTVTDESGTGWQSQFTDVVPEYGADGDWAIHYELDFDKVNGAVCRLTQAHNYVHFSGPGSGAVLKLQCWGDSLPGDYEVSIADSGVGQDMTDFGQTVVFLRSDGKWYNSDDGSATATGRSYKKITHVADVASLPAGGGSGTYVVDDTNTAYRWNGSAWTTSAVYTSTRIVVFSHVPIARYSSYATYQRGSMFVMEPDGLSTFEGIEFSNFKMDGQTLANGGGSWYNAYDFLNEWDITNKGIVFTFGGRDMGQTAPIKVEDCDIIGFRGEVLYKGGTDSDCYVEIRRCTIGETNSVMRWRPVWLRIATLTT